METPTEAATCQCCRRCIFICLICLNFIFIRIRISWEQPHANVAAGARFTFIYIHYYCYGWMIFSRRLGREQPHANVAAGTRFIFI